MSELIERINGSNRTAENLSILIEAAHLLNSTIEYEALLANVMRLVGRAVDAEAAMIYRYEGSTKTLRGRFSTGSNQPTQMVFKVGQGFIGWVAEHHQPVLSNNPTEDDRFFAEIYGTGGFVPHSLICFPLKLRGKFFGVVAAVNKRDGQFLQSDLDTLDLLSDQIALAINNSRLYRTIKNQALQRKTLFEVSKKLISSLTLDEVLLGILQAVKKVVEFDAGGVYLIEDNSSDVESITSIGYGDIPEAELHLKIGQGIVGTVARTGQAELIGDVSKDSRYIDARTETKSEIVVPIMLDEKLIGVINLEHNDPKAFTIKDIDILSAFAPQAAFSIERARMHKIMLEQKKLEEQLSIARTIQSTFLPKGVPKIKNFDIWGTNIPSGEVGGDYYDFIRIVDNQLGIAIADVSGKGIPASLIMASFRASLIAEIRNNYAIRTICRKVNNLLCESLKPENFVTGIYGVLDTKNSIFTFSNCGHNPGILYRASGEVVELTEGGLIMGIRPEAVYEERPVYMNPGDILCLYTDGIIEAEDSSEEQFETERLLDMIREDKNLPAADIGAGIIQAVRAFADKSHIMDDLTLVIIKRI